MKRIALLLAVVLFAVPCLAADAPKAPAAPAAVVAPAAPAAPAVPAAAVAASAPVTAAAPAVAPTATEPAATPDPEKDLGGFMVLLLDAFKNKNWGVFAGLVIMLLVWITRKFIPKMPTSALPWVSAGMGIVASVATDLIAGGTWYVAIFNGLLLGAAASGMWSLVGKHVFVKKETAPEAPKA